MERTRRFLGVCASDAVAAVAAVALAAMAAPPGLDHMRQKTRAVACANNLRVCNQAFNVYGDQFRGTWIAPWDQQYRQQLGSYIWAPMWPYTMIHYVQGRTIEDGLPVYWPNAGGWWGAVAHYGDDPEGGDQPPVYYTYERGGSPTWEWPETNDVDVAPQMQCPEMARRGPECNPSWYDTTSYSYAIMNRKDTFGDWRSSLGHYPIPDFMTHPSSTVHMYDMATPTGEHHPNAWSGYDNMPSDPHDGKSNYVFCDGHVEMLAAGETNERMWQDRWAPEPAQGE